MRNMSFAFTTQQMRDGTKTVTRRLGWDFLKPGDTVMACVKCQGLKKGEHVERIHPIKIVSSQRESLYTITPEDVIREGFPKLDPIRFIVMFCEHMDCSPSKLVNRIEFEHLV